MRDPGSEGHLAGRGRTMSALVPPFFPNTVLAGRASRVVVDGDRLHAARPRRWLRGGGLGCPVHRDSDLPGHCLVMLSIDPFSFPICKSEMLVGKSIFWPTTSSGLLHQKYTGLVTLIVSCCSVT